MKGVIDRFVGGFAVVLFEEQRAQLDVPKDEIKGNPSEGDWVEVKFIPNKKYTKERSEEIEKLTEKLAG